MNEERKNALRETPAFPSKEVYFQERGDGICVDEKERFFPGMTLRDWYKGQALIGILSNHTLVDDSQLMSPDKLSKQCGQIADSMLAEREGK